MTVIRKDNLKKSIGSTGYPPPFDDGPDRYAAYQLTDVAGLTQFGASLEILHPGGMSSQRHWHEEEDEVLFVLSGEVVLVESDGRHVLRAGDAAGWKAAEPNAHHVINRSDADASYLIVGTRAQHDKVHYPDIDLEYVRDASGRRFTHKDGTPYD
ncbi:MAG: cupin domain-containing protein [Rhodobacteraceae bacterium]|nr:cupin domain-containing protein [Paracoccaceae bacterium]